MARVFQAESSALQARNDAVDKAWTWSVFTGITTAIATGIDTTLARAVDRFGSFDPPNKKLSGERVVLWCLYDPDANEAKPWRVQWKEGGEKMGTRKGRDDVRVKA